MYSVSTIKQFINENRQNIKSFFRKIRLRLFLDKQNFEHLRKTFPCPKKWYGSSYGGFYVNPNLLNENSIVYSFGIGKDISFDKKIMKNHQCKVYGFDPTPKSIEYIKANAHNPLFVFHDFGIAVKSGIEKFFMPLNEKAVSSSMTLSPVMNEDNVIKVKMKSFDEIAGELGHDHIDVVKMDIEGSEYEVLEAIFDSNVTITQLLVEFHDRFYENEIKSKKITALLRKKGFEVFGNSINFEEISFINTNLVKES